MSVYALQEEEHVRVGVVMGVNECEINSIFSPWSSKRSWRDSKKEKQNGQKTNRSPDIKLEDLVAQLPCPILSHSPLLVTLPLHPSSFVVSEGKTRRTSGDLSIPFLSLFFSQVGEIKPERQKVRT